MDTSKDRCKWDHLMAIRIIPEEHIREVKNQGTISSNFSAHCTYTVELQLQGTCLSGSPIIRSAWPFR